MDLSSISPLFDHGTGDSNASFSDADYPAYDGDTSSFDYVHYMPGESLLLIKKTWPEDPAFIPTSLTYSLAFIIGVTGNFLVIFALVGDKKARNATSSFLVSLAVADLVFLLVCIPYDTVSKMTGFWSGGKPLCKISGFAEMLSAAASILNLTAVSVERYVVIVHPMKARSWFSTRKMVQILLAVWLISVLLSSPIIYAMGTNTGLFYNNESSVVVQTCSDINFSEDTSRIVFAWYQLAVMFLLPTAVIIYCYAVVIRVLWISTKQLAKMTRIERDDGSRQHLTSDSTKIEHQQSGHRVVRQAVKDHSSEVREARKQVIKMLLAVIGMFLLCWGPRLILNIMKRHHLRILHNDSAFVVSLVIDLLPYIQSATNPVIYGFMSKKFRQSLRSACLKNCCCCECVQDKMRMDKISRLSDYDLDSKSVVTNGNCTQTTSILDARKHNSMTSF